MGIYNSSGTIGFTGGDFRSGEKFKGKYDPTKGASQVQDMERTLGIEAFDSDSYSSKLGAGLRANVDESTKAMRASRGNQVANSGFLNSGAARKLDEGAILSGERTYAMGTADIAQDAAGKKLTEDANRMGFASDNAKQNYAATLDTWKAGEEQRQYDNDASYGQALDSYQLNVIDPKARADAKSEAAKNREAAMWGSILSAGGRLGGAAITGGA